MDGLLPNDGWESRRYLYSRSPPPDATTPLHTPSHGIEATFLQYFGKPSECGVKHIHIHCPRDNPTLKFHYNGMGH